MRGVRIRLEEMADAIAGIEETLAGSGFDDFTRSWSMQRAVERGLEIISEASRGIPADIKGLCPEVPWNQIAGIGNILRHEYHRVEPIIIWNITKEPMATLSTAIQKLLAEAP